MQSRERTIKIRGPIGSFKYLDNGKPVQVNGMQLIDLVTQITQLPPETNALIVEIGSMGGSVPVAKSMRDVLKSVSGRMKVTTRQVDDIASAGTILFGVGKERIAARGINPNTGDKFKMMVHNTWLPQTSGNAEELHAQADSLQLSDAEFVDIYTEDTGVTAEAIAPLMKAETFFDADQAVAIKFATGVYNVGLQQAAYSTNKKPTAMKGKKTNKALAALASLLGLETDETLGAATDLIGKAVMIDGAPAQDYTYTVKGGVITAVEPIAEEEAEPAAGAAGTNGKPAPAAAMTEERVLALIQGAGKGKKKPAATDDDDDDDDAGTGDVIQKLGTAIATAIAQGQRQHKQGQRSGGAPGGSKEFAQPVGYNPTKRDELAKEWDRSFRANEHAAMKRDDREKWETLFFAKYGKMPQ
jgi:ATP-dependent protease ClpP protease subunit